MKRVLYIVIIALCFGACGKHEKTSGGQSPIRVRTMVVAPRTDVAATRYVGTVEPARETPLSMQTSGRVTAVNVKNGDRVSKWQVLVEVDNTQALNALQGAKASLEHAEDGCKRARQVHEKGVITDQKMVEIESQRTQAQALYDAALQRLEECSLTAPCDGVVNGLELTNGQTVIPGTRVCSIMDVTAFSVRFTVPEGEINKLKGENGKLKGENGKRRGVIECAAVDTVLPVIITETGIAANPVTHTYEVVARIQGGADVLMSGMVAKVKITNEREQEDIIIPARCVLLKPEGYTVWVMEQGTAVRRDIVVDGYRADGVRVISGLNEGDTLITDGYQKLYKNCKVTEN